MRKRPGEPFHAGVFMHDGGQWLSHGGERALKNFPTAGPARRYVRRVLLSLPSARRGQPVEGCGAGKA
jgi:hypothetical protein